MTEPGYKLRLPEAGYWLFMGMLLCIWSEQDPVGFSEDNQYTGNYLNSIK